MKQLLVFGAVLVLTACSLTPNKAKVITAETLDTLSYQLDQYEKRGWIEDKKEDELQKSLLFAFDLATGSQQAIDTFYCPEAKEKSECISDITLKVETLLREIANER